MPNTYKVEYNASSSLYGRAGCIPFHRIRFSNCMNAVVSSIRPVLYRNDQKCRCRNKTGARSKGPSSVPECSSTGLRCQKWHRPRCYWPAMLKTCVLNVVWSILQVKKLICFNVCKCKFVAIFEEFWDVQCSDNWKMRGIQKMAIVLVLVLDCD